MSTDSNINAVRLEPLTGEDLTPHSIDPGGSSVVGRSSGCAIRLEHDSVSKQHAQLEYAEGRWRVCDLESLNGTFVNGRRVSGHESPEIKDGDAIGFGVCEFKVVIRSASNLRQSSQTDAYATRATMFGRLNQEDPEGRELGWEEFRQRYAPVIVGFARNAGIPTQDLDDVLQEVMLGFYQVASRFEYDPSRGRFRGYLKRATLNVIRKRWRKRSPAGSMDIDDLSDDAPVAETMWDQQWAEQLMTRALDSIKGSFDERTFEAFELYHRRGVPAAETARRLDISINSVHQAKSRVLAAVTEVLEQIRSNEG